MQRLFAIGLIVLFGVSTVDCAIATPHVTSSIINKGVVSHHPNDYFDLGENNTLDYGEEFSILTQTFVRARQFYLDMLVEDATFTAPVKKPYWTQFFNSDTPKGIGDVESVRDIRNCDVNICNGATPAMAVCQIKGKNFTKFSAHSGTPPNKLRTKCSPVDGVVCINADQPSGTTCEDYEIQFYCLRQIRTHNVHGTLFKGITNLTPRHLLPPTYLAKNAAKDAVTGPLKVGLKRPCVRQVTKLNVSVDVPKSGAVRQYYEIQVSGVIRERKLIVNNFLYTVWVDAITSLVLKMWEDGDFGLAASGVGGNDKIGTYFFGQSKPALDVSEGQGKQCVMANSKVRVVHNQFTSETSNTLPHTYDCATGNNDMINGGKSPLNDALFHATKLFELYQSWFQRDVITNPPITVRVHFGDKLDMARYDPPSKSVFLGDGSTQFYPMTDSNIVAHELAHAFILETSKLQNRFQSGAISESLADITAEALEFFIDGKVDWKIATAVTKNGGTDALRYFEVPGIDGHSKGHFRDYSDSVDIHFTSGIFNRAFFKLATTSGWGVKKAYETFWVANVMHWKRCTGMRKASCGVIDAAASLGMSKTDVVNAFFDVGLECSDAVRLSADQCD